MIFVVTLKFVLFMSFQTLKSHFQGTLSVFVAANKSIGVAEKAFWDSGEFCEFVVPYPLPIFMKKYPGRNKKGNITDTQIINAFIWDKSPINFNFSIQYFTDQFTGAF